jgi:hypothetical protein
MPTTNPVLATDYPQAISQQLQTAAERAALDVWLNPQMSLRTAVRHAMEDVATGSIPPSQTMEDDTVQLAEHVLQTCK